MDRSNARNMRGGRARCTQRLPKSGKHHGGPVATGKPSFATGKSGSFPFKLPIAGAKPQRDPSRAEKNGEKWHDQTEEKRGRKESS